MSGSWPKVIRDPVHDLIPFEDNPCDRFLWDLINAKEFQRLRRIKQLGVSSSSRAQTIAVLLIPLA